MSIPGDEDTVSSTVDLPTPVANLTNEDALVDEQGQSIAASDSQIVESPPGPSNDDTQHQGLIVASQRQRRKTTMSDETPTPPPGIDYRPDPPKIGGLVRSKKDEWVA